MDTEGGSDGLRALDAGRGAISLDGFRVVGVRGADADPWLQDLLTADVSRLEAGQAVRSLLLGPTGRIRADVHVLRTSEGFLLVQDPRQPTPVSDLLSPYVLSSDVDVTQEPAPPLVAVPGPRAWRFVDAAAEELVPVDAAAVESWRIRRGIPRFPVDLDEDSLPAEGDLDDGTVIDRVKGCYLGQESVAKVRNLGHPTRVVLAVRGDAEIAAGESVLADGAEVGTVTSVDPVGGDGVAALARVRWDARRADLATRPGVRLVRT